MKKRDIGLRAQDIQTGLQEVDLRGPAAGLFDRTLLTGMAERLAIHIRGTEIIDEEGRLYAVADRLGIESLLLPTVLRFLEEAEFVRVEYEGDRPRHVFESVPYFEDIYERLGEIWESRGPREEERASVQLLDQLASSPCQVDEVKDEYGLEDSQLDVILRVGGEGGYFGQFVSQSDDSTVLYSPLYWEEKPEETFKLVQRYGGQRIAKAIRAVRSCQGMPMPDLGPNSTEDDRIVVEAMAMGLLPSPQVDSFGGRRRFAFTPYQGQIALTESERAVLQKARAILACIRYGEHFGTITKVDDPEAIVGALLRRGRIGPHSEIVRQYAILVVEGVARISPDTRFSDRYHLSIIDTEENKKALRLAADMLTVGEAITQRGLDERAKSLLFNGGMFKEPLTTRSEEIMRRKREPHYAPATVQRQFERIIDSIRGL